MLDIAVAHTVGVYLMAPFAFLLLDHWLVELSLQIGAALQRVG